MSTSDGALLYVQSIITLTIDLVYAALCLLNMNAPNWLQAHAHLEKDNLCTKQCDDNSQLSLCSYESC